MPATRGTPVQGSRSAHNVDNPDLHASDIEDGAFTVHNDPDASEGEAMVMGGAGAYVATDVLTPTEHTAIGDNAPHHAAVTLGVDNDTDMATLVAQALTVVLKDHDHSGDAGDGGVLVMSHEVLMQDGVTAPPVPIETEAQDDWLYEG